MELQFLGHSFFRVAGEGTTVLFDPLLNFRPRADGLKPSLKQQAQKSKLLDDVSLLVISHEHTDHFDKAAIEEAASKNNACIVAHDSVLSQLSLPKPMLRAVSAGDKISLRGCEIEAIPAHHPQAFYPLSFLLTLGGKRIFFAGDTDLTDTLTRVKADVALLPIGGTYTMDLVDAVRATKAIKPQYAIPMHYNTYPEIKADPHEFRQRIEKSILKTKAVVLEQGECFKF
ncbi:MAG: metal-dependent hydrolase [Candidatus Diapherotrites archaeon]